MNEFTYTNLKGQVISLAGLDEAERQLVAELSEHQERATNWNDFSNYWMRRVSNFYSSRGLSRRETATTAAWRVAQDLDGRLAVRLGLARAPDYRDEIEELIRSQFVTQRAFCQATGLSEDMVSHVLARRKHLAVDTLSEALEKIGYRLRIVPMAEAKG